MSEPKRPSRWAKVALAAGLGAALTLLGFVAWELSYDRFHTQADRIFRLTIKINVPGQAQRHTALTAAPMGPTIAAEVAAVREAVRFLPYFEASLPGRGAVSYGERNSIEDFFWVDGSFFRTFSIPLLAGDPATALEVANTAVITARTAKKLFGDENPLGKTLRIDCGYTAEEYRVTGVLADMPANFHLPFDVMLAVAGLYQIEDERVVPNNWGDFDSYTFLLLADGVAPGAVEEQANAVLDRHMAPEVAKKIRFRLQPLTAIRRGERLLNEPRLDSLTHRAGLLGGVAAALLLLTAGVAALTLQPAGSLGLRRGAAALLAALCVVLALASGTTLLEVRRMLAADGIVGKERIAVFPLRDVTLRERYLELKGALAAAGAEATTLFALAPGREAPQIGTKVGERPIKQLGTLVVDHDFLSFFGRRLLAGRNFVAGDPEDITSSFLLNLSAVRELGFARPEEALGQAVVWGPWKTGRIIGMVEDFHYQPLTFAIKPLILHPRPIAYHYLFARLPPGERDEQAARLARAGREVLPFQSFAFSFLDEEMRRLYREREQLGWLLALLTVVVALSAFALWQACTRERSPKALMMTPSLPLEGGEDHVQSHSSAGGPDVGQRSAAGR